MQAPHAVQPHTASAGMANSSSACELASPRASRSPSWLRKWRLLISNAAGERTFPVA